MDQYLTEVDASFAAFTSRWPSDLERCRQEILSHGGDRFQKSYRRLISLQAWRTSLLEHSTSSGALQFFLEAQNDALLSHVFASLGSWRAALKELRSCLENILFCLFYKDHPVELQLWEMGKHRISFSDLIAYFELHPHLEGVSPELSGIVDLKKEYATLSKAVHGSSAGFRMTQGAESVLLWKANQASLGAWVTREGKTLAAINLLLIALHRAELSGARHVPLRQAISLAVPRSLATKIREHLQVTLPAET